MLLFYFKRAIWIPLTTYIQSNVQIFLKAVWMLHCPQQVEHTVFAFILLFCLIALHWCQPLFKSSGTHFLSLSAELWNTHPFEVNMGIAVEEKALSLICMIKANHYNVNTKNKGKYEQSCKMCCRQRWINKFFYTVIKIK